MLDLVIANPAPTRSRAIGRLRVLERRGFIVPEPRKQPKSSFIGFEAELPNECWRADVTHWALADGTDVEILDFIGDHSRVIVAAEVRPVTKAA